MPERDNDRLESFFKKVSGRPDISYSEEDWKKLEARLDAKATRSSIARRNRSRLAGASAIAILLVGGLYWLTQVNPEQPSLATLENKGESISDSKVVDAEPMSSLSTDIAAKKSKNESVSIHGSDVATESLKTSKGADVKASEINKRNEAPARPSIVNVRSGANKSRDLGDVKTAAPLVEELAPVLVTTPSNEIQSNDLEEIMISPAIADKIKQKANIADSLVREENDVTVKDAYGSGLTEHPASPRLSLLLSIAPDFSTVAFDYYTDPGQSFGLMLHYHVKRSWSFSAGVVKSFKKYMGDGEDYTPPNGYWRNNTNGIIPETIDGSCNVLEIPIMVHYTLANKGKSRFLVGAGTSSYIMLKESYKYNFDQPNPGAKQGWNSKKASGLFFNVINVTAGFEHRVFPGFMMGIEPYLKIPIAGVGWSDLKLYRAGASLTLRYIILNQKHSSTAALSQGPG